MTNALFATATPPAATEGGGMTFKVNFGPVMDFFSGVGSSISNGYGYMQDQPILMWYLIGAWVLSAFIVPLKFRSLGTIAISPLWLPVYMLCKGAGFVFSAKRGNNVLAMTEVLAANTLSVKDAASELKEAAATIAKSGGGKIPNIGVVTKNQQVLNESMSKIVDKIDDDNAAVLTAIGELHDELLGFLESQLEAFSATEEYASEGEYTVSNAETEGKMEAVNAICDAFADKGDDFIVSLGSVKQPSRNTRSFQYRIGIRLGALRNGDFGHDDVTVLRDHAPTTGDLPNTQSQRAKAAPQSRGSQKVNDFVDALRTQ